LYLFSPPEPRTLFLLGYWETGVVLGYDDTDVVYSHQGIAAGNVVFANDVRLTPFDYLVAGSKVAPQDNDIGMKLTPLQCKRILWVNSYGGPGHNLDDPVYIHVGWGPNTVTNDVRLSNVGGLAPGSKVGNLDSDLPNAFAIPWFNNPNPIIQTGFGGVILPADWPRVRYVDNNGDSQYDYPDDVYL
jgi:hypothetical protein